MPGARGGRGAAGARRGAPLVAALTASVLVAACERGAAGQEAAPLPTASIAPAALASGSAAPRKAGAPDGGKPVASAEGVRTPLPEAGPPEPEPWEPGQVVRDSPAAREVPGVELALRVAWSDVPAPPMTPEASREGMRDAAAQVTLTLAVELGGHGRLRLVFTGGGFPLPRGSELRGRVDRQGALAVWPDGASYRVLPAGTLRAVLAERRADVLPLVAGKLVTAPGRAVLGQAVTRSRWSTELGEVILDQARVPGLGWAGAVLCQWLVELAAVAPETEGCGEDLVPLRAELQWASGGRWGVEATALTRRVDLPSGPLTVPPAGARERDQGLPEPRDGLLLSAAELTALRSRATLVDERPAPDAPAEGLVVENGADRLIAVLVDGVTVAWVPSGRQVAVAGLRPGRYSVAFRDFLGERVVPPVTSAVPARLSVAP